VSYKYRIVEEALARTLGVREEDLPAFRAKLRHLRNLGVPPIDKPGSGRKVAYQPSDAYRMLVALELEILGFTPKTAATGALSMMSAWLPSAVAAATAGKPFFLRTYPIFSLRPDLADGLRWSSNPASLEEAHRVISIDIAQSIRALDDWLTKLTADKS
jgi:hypothetical protein